MRNSVLFSVFFVLFGCEMQPVMQIVPRNDAPGEVDSSPAAPVTTVAASAPPMLMAEAHGQQHERRKVIAPSLPPSTCPTTIPAPYTDDARAKKETLIVVFKSMFRMGLYHNGELRQIDGHGACFAVAMGQKPWGPKFKYDWKSTPEGWYYVASKRDIGQSMFYRAFAVSYPNTDDVQRAFDNQVINRSLRDRLLAQIKAGKMATQGTAMGGSIMIHGLGSENPFWTAGCIAANNEVLDIVFPFVRERDNILIIPWDPEDAHKKISIPIDPTPEDPYTPETTEFMTIEPVDP